MLLGLDISTSSTGWCLLNFDGTLVDIGYVPLGKIKDVFKKAQCVREIIVDLSSTHNITKVAVEENLQAFRPGFSSAKTLMSLARFNGIISYICARDLDINPEFINVNIARKLLGLKINRAIEKTTKDQVLDWVSTQLSDTGFEWPVKKLKNGPRKGMIVLDKGCYDMSDAYVIARAFIEMNKQ